MSCGAAVRAAAGRRADASRAAWPPLKPSSSCEGCHCCEPISHSAVRPGGVRRHVVSAVSAVRVPSQSANEESVAEIPFRTRTIRTTDRSAVASRVQVCGARLEFSSASRLEPTARPVTASISKSSPVQKSEVRPHSAITACADM